MGIPIGALALVLPTVGVGDHPYPATPLLNHGKYHLTHLCLRYFLNSPTSLQLHCFHPSPCHLHLCLGWSDEWPPNGLPCFPRTPLCPFPVQQPEPLLLNAVQIPLLLYSTSPGFCLLFLICYPDSHHESHVSCSSIARCLLLLKHLPLLQQAKPVPTSGPLHLLCPLPGPLFLWRAASYTGFPHNPKVRVSYETFRKLKWYKAKKQLPQDTSCSRTHKIKQDKAQMLTDTVQSSGGLMMSC